MNRSLLVLFWTHNFINSDKPPTRLAENQHQILTDVHCCSSPDLLCTGDDDDLDSWFSVQFSWHFHLSELRGLQRRNTPLKMVMQSRWTFKCTSLNPCKQNQKKLDFCTVLLFLFFKLICKACTSDPHKVNTLSYLQYWVNTFDSLKKTVITHIVSFCSLKTFWSLNSWRSITSLGSQLSRISLQSLLTLLPHPRHDAWVTRRSWEPPVAREPQWTLITSEVQTVCETDSHS